MEEFDGDLLESHSFQQATKKVSSEKEAAIEAAKAHFSALATFNMAMIERIEALEKEKTTQDDDVQALHKALNSVLALYVLDHGYDDYCVEIGLQALARHPELPVRASLAEKIETLRHSSDGK